ncbi:MAG TPA: hypothetical protein VLE51_03095 [Candidatus Saccharimonadales bacterium]|nr:hypothetical protein [Candidatus Saccharimonadales bacterium]
MSEFELGSGEQEPTFVPEKAREFLGWVFKEASHDHISQIPEAHLPAMFDILTENATDRLKAIRDWRRKKQLQAPIDLMRRWVEGQSLHQIYKETGKSEDSVRFALATYAERLGALENLDELITNANVRVVATEAATEVELEQPPEQSVNGDVAYNRRELVQLLLQEVIELPALEEYSHVPPEAYSSEELLGDYPMMAKLSRTTGLDQILKDAGII